MFNNLEDSKSQDFNAHGSEGQETRGSTEISSPNNSPVDDIFAETDKVVESGMPESGEIDARRVGLAVESEKLDMKEEVDSKKTKKGSSKLVIVAVIVIILGLVGYLAYQKLFSVESVDQSPATNQPNTKTASSDPVVPAPKENTSEPITPADIIIDTVTGTDTLEEKATTTEEETVIDEPVFLPIIDSDNDGLTDDEEMVAGTNINIIDTDNDGLSDYEEIKIYKSNPLNADSDGDGYQDGAEVRGGYNPNGPGKLPGNSIE